jgi:hypothetical protein
MGRTEQKIVKWSVNQPSPSSKKLSISQVQHIAEEGGLTVWRAEASG